MWQPKLTSDDEANERLWELFHENSKTESFSIYPSPDDVARRMSALHETLDFKHYPAIHLAHKDSLISGSLNEALIERRSASAFAPKRMTLDQVATVLHFGFGTRSVEQQNIRPKRRFAPSAGALYPLEAFFYVAHVPGIETGLWHFNPIDHIARLLRPGDLAQELSEVFLQVELLNSASLIIFVAAMFERTTFKYGDRGYRFALIEAGHVAQNVNLVTASMQLGCVNIGGFLDRKIDAILDFNGVDQSVIYAQMIGSANEQANTSLSRW